MGISDPPTMDLVVFIQAGALQVEAITLSRGLRARACRRAGRMVASSWLIEKCASAGSAAPAGRSS
ncbi:MAG: hypothetical protein NVSMB32_03040 [Actinomycetota bacterium]